MTDTVYNNYPFDDVVLEAGKKIKEGVKVHQKFTCEKCLSRQTMEMANIFYESGICEECGHETDILKHGCNYVAMIGIS